MAGQRVITFVPIRQKGFDAKIDFHATVQPVQMAERVRVNDVIGLIGQLDVEARFQQVVEEIIGLPKPRPEIAEINEDGLARVSHLFINVSYNSLTCRAVASKEN